MRTLSVRKFINPRYNINVSSTFHTTLAHELAHAVLHTEETHNQYTAQEKEFQAEMVAYTVSSYFGLDTSEYSLPYLHHWTSGKELKEQERLLKKIPETAHEFISVIEEEFVKERDKEKVFDQEKVDPFEEALMVQENYGMTSNVPEWDNEEFLTYLKSVDEEAYEQFIDYKRMHERKVENKETDILLIKCGYLSNTEERYVSMNELKELARKKGLYLENLGREDFVHAFNETFKGQYAVVDSNTLNRPSILIQWSEASHQFQMLFCLMQRGI